jgi:hypothetical protein
MAPGTRIANEAANVHIKLTSTLTSEDENRFAPEVLTALTKVLNSLPITYAIRIDTCDRQVYELCNADDYVDRRERASRG